ncbi:MAG: ATP-binding protein [Desulfobacterales bacterium]
MTALDVLLDDLYRFLSELHVTPGSSVLLIRNDGTVMLPRDANQKLIVEHTENVSFVSPANIEKDLIRDAIDVWERSRTGSFAVKAFSSEGKTWWAGFKPLQPEASKTWIGVIIPQEDLEGNLRQKWLHVVSIGAGILVAGSILIAFLIRRFSQQNSFQPAGDRRSENIENDLAEMISVGESSTLEFKSTLRTNLKTGKTDKAIELAWLKSAVAFMNSEGGRLLIGVNDSSGIEGIGADGFENHDRCRLNVKNLINQHIGAEFSRYIDSDIKVINGKTIVIITCEKAADPVFLKVGKNEDFFIRSGPSSIRLSMSKMVKYLQQRK